MPFIIEDKVNAHQIPDNPRPIWDRSRASGMREAVSVMLMTLHSVVLPRPESAPIVISSTLIKASLKPIIIRYPAAISMTSGS